MYLIRLCYDGTAYSGYQRQKNSRTVGQELLSAAEAVFGEVKRFAGCSRTDSGVHAYDYAVSFSAAKPLSPDTVVRAMNANLPEDISVYSCRIVPDDFHARYSVISKEYVYNIYTGEVRSPIYGKYSLFYPRDIDILLVDKGLKKFEGRHDFRSFMASGSKITDTVRTVFSSHVEKDGEMVRIYIEADGFLYNMVRIIIGTLLGLNENKISLDDIDKIIEKKDRKFAGRTVPAYGMFLNRVNYGQ